MSCLFFLTNKICENFKKTLIFHLKNNSLNFQERRDREKPSRSLFVRNIPYDVTQEEMNTLFTEYGPLSRFYNLIPKRGIAFITFVS